MEATWREGEKEEEGYVAGGEVALGEEVVADGEGEEADEGEEEVVVEEVIVTLVEG